MLVRTRTEADLDRCEHLARIVHDVNGYPPHLPGDLRGFIVTTDALAAWVAIADGELVGHVALHRHSSSEVMDLASKSARRPAERLGIVARLFVSPGARRHGVGRLLLQTAADGAVERDLVPILDVATRFRASIHLYERCGWRRVGSVTVRFGNGTTIDELVYLGPTSSLRFGESSDDPPSTGDPGR